MARLWSLAGLLVSLRSPLSAALALDSSPGCPGERATPAEIPAASGALSACALTCSARTYRQLLEKRDARTVRFSAATAGKHGDHCWSTEVMHGDSESLQRAYVVLPVDTELAAWEPLSLRTTCPVHHDALKPHHGAAAAMSRDCGLTFDVTTFFSSGRSFPLFCIEIVPQLSSLRGALRCPPFLVTTWLRQYNPYT
ncbi:uncharacterized protein LOC114910731 isoform X3 [Scleropages formosus]|nr:uncharacterized protein LOC114910731 isoform X3 [Scleropages formosus]